MLALPITRGGETVISRRSRIAKEAEEVYSKLVLPLCYRLRPSV